MIIFRLPFGQEIYTIEEKSNGHFPVVFFGFDKKIQIPFEGNIVEYQGDINLNTNHLSPITPKITEIQQEEYFNKIDEVVEFIKGNQLQKLVFSRKKVIENFNKIDLTESFENLCESYPNALVYLFQKENQCWLGAFSELLGKYHHDTQVFETMSLAGTLPKEEAWTRKEIEEQKPVTEYIEGILSQYDAVEKSATYDHISGKIKHLRTDFKTKIKEEEVEKVINLLHPTPAVCGIPKDLCQKAIIEFEKHDRELYAGYSRIKLNGITYFFVNLRCAKFHQNEAHLFVGGGITSESNAQKEWRETELKSHAILDNLSFIEQ
ncbi:MAG: hypothetical protein CSA38_04555 [Flavobacteriales bacterium]|nr:MAG: hypothetical protein CSA38_04555 [Flavobacteriales bacterium]